MSASMRPRKNLLMLLAGFISLFVAVIYLRAANETLTPASLRRDIRKFGAKEVIHRLNEQKWDRLCEKIEQGQPEWLALAPLLRPGTDASYTLGLEYSVARALPVAPKVVLGFIGHGFTIDRVCTVPFIEADIKTEVDYLTRTKSALQTLSAGDLEYERKKCLEEIAAIEKESPQLRGTAPPNQPK